MIAEQIEHVWLGKPKAHSRKYMKRQQHRHWRRFNKENEPEKGNPQYNRYKYWEY